MNVFDGMEMAGEASCPINQPFWCLQEIDPEQGGKDRETTGEADKMRGPLLLQTCCVSFIKLLPLSEPYLLHLWQTGYILDLPATLGVMTFKADGGSEVIL